MKFTNLGKVVLLCLCFWLWIYPIGYIIYGSDRPDVYIQNVYILGIMALALNVKSFRNFINSWQSNKEQ